MRKRPQGLDAAIDDAEWEHMVASSLGYGIYKLWRQLTITEARIGNDLLDYESTKADLAFETLVLDLETYYTVAHDLLKLGTILLPSDQSKQLKSEPDFRRICGVRNHLVRHAFDKPDGDPFGNLAISPVVGPRLKGGSIFGGFNDPGFKVNDQDLSELMNKYQFSQLPRAPLTSGQRRAARRQLNARAREGA